MLLRSIGSASQPAGVAPLSHGPPERTCRDCTPGYCL